MRLGHWAFLRRREDTAGRCLQGAPSVARRAGLAVVVLAAAACSGRSGRDAGPPADAQADPASARALASPLAPLPSRAEALSLAQGVEARAALEATGARAVELHAAAASLLERVWRVEGKPQDLAEALDLYRLASRPADMPGACAAALAAARLAGEAAHDPATTYAETYRALRRFAASEPPADAGTAAGCRRALEADLSLAAAFRPAQRVLEAIDQGLAGEGSVALSLGAALDAGPSSPAPPPQMTQVDAWPGADAARVVVALSRPAGYRISDEVVGAGARTVVDLDGVDVGGVVRDIALSGVVGRVRAEATSTGSRVLLDLDGRPWRRVFVLKEPFRVVLDIARRPPGSEERAVRRVARIVLDPGHGGKDAGALGPAGTREKDVTLDVAHRVAPILAGQGLQVVLTRDDDRYVSLEERTARANGFGADLFVSIHCNASEGRGRRGIETYILDASRDEIAARVAARENATSADASAELPAVLGGMRLADEAARSSRLARLLQRASTVAAQTRYGDVVDGGVHTAGFYVLVGARMPSVLFETSYISNPAEEQRLADGQYRQLLADAIANAIKAYREGR